MNPGGGPLGGPPAGLFWLDASDATDAPMLPILLMVSSFLQGETARATRPGRPVLDAWTQQSSCHTVVVREL